MAIVIDNIPSGQVLDVKYGNARNLSMSVSGLDPANLGQVTASLDGYKMSEFFNPPGVASITTPPPTPPSPPGSLLVILTLVGSVVNLLAVDPADSDRADREPDDFAAELTVTITQGPLSSSATEVHAYYLNEPNLLDGSCSI